MREGIQKGESNKAHEIACKLKNMGIPIEQIIESTGLSQNEIEKMS